MGVMFKGTKLIDGSQTLADAGVTAGDTLNIVPSRRTGGTAEDDKPAAVSDDGDDSDSEDEVGASAVSPPAGKAGGADLLSGMSAGDREAMEKMVDQMGGKEGMQSMLKQMGLDGPMTPDKIEGLMGQVKQMLANPAITAMFENPEILEKSRQQILSNPMMMQAYDGMGMGALIRDPAAFRAQMEGMKQMLENPDMLAQAMKGMADPSAVDDFDQGDL